MNSKWLLGVAALLPLSGNAGDFDYTYFEGGFVNTELDLGPLDVDGDGIGIKGSYAFNDRFHGFATYATQDFDFDVDANQFEIGGGYNWDLSPNIQAVGTLAFVSAEVESGPVSVDDDGFGVGAGLRGRPAPKVEVEGGVDYVDLDDSNTSFRIDGRYYFNDIWAAGGGISFDDDATSWRIGVRAEFGK